MTALLELKQKIKEINNFCTHIDFDKPQVYN